MSELPEKPFTIGMSPLGERPWLITDDRLPAYLAEKARLSAACPDKVFMAEPGTDAAQHEALAHVARWQTTHHPALFRAAGDAAEMIDAPDMLQCSPAAPALLRAAMLCAEDLVLMRKGEKGWRLAAAALHFPSSWRLSEKFGKPMEAVHAPVPGFADGTRNAVMINRIFDNLTPDATVLRGNWSIYTDSALYHPEPHQNDPQEALANGFVLREERQTLTRLPETGDILFTILITLTPFTDLAVSPAGREKAAHLAAQIDAMTESQRAYKGISQRAGHLSSLLGQISAQ